MLVVKARIHHLLDFKKIKLKKENHNTMKMIEKRTFTWMNKQEKRRGTFICEECQVDLFNKISTTFSLKLSPQTTKYLKKISGKITCEEIFKIQMNNWQE